MLALYLILSFFTQFFHWLHIFLNLACISNVIMYSLHAHLSTFLQKKWLKKIQCTNIDGAALLAMCGLQLYCLQF